MLELRPYQTEAILEIEKHFEKNGSSLLVMAVGTGKTEVAVGFVKKSLEENPNFRAIFLVNKLQLVDQTCARFKKYLGDIVDVYCSSRNSWSTSKPLTVASIQSINKIDIQTNVIIIDEVHRVGEEGIYNSFINLLTESNKDLKIIGLTATPWRSNDLIYGAGRLFNSVTYEKDILWAIENKYLVKPVAKFCEDKFDTSELSIKLGDFAADEVERMTSDKTKMRKQVEDALKRLDGRKKVAWACSGIRHCEEVSMMLLEYGEESITVHSNKKENSIEPFEFGQIRHVCFVTMLSEGFDCPIIDSIILLRPTRSPVLYVQTIGRGLRLHKDKTDCLILDYGEVIENCGPIHAPYIGMTRRQVKKSEIKMKFCPKCLTYILSTVYKCPECGYEYPKVSVDHNKNLATKAASSDIMNPSLSECRILSVSFENQISKNGNEMYKVTFRTNLFKAPFINEWVVKQDWALEKFENKTGITVFKNIDLSTKNVRAFIQKNEKGYWGIRDIESDIGLSE